MVSYDEKTRLLSERWNAPVVVTTSVKFFEVFFKYKPSDLRFLHSISNSVIVFDEAQSVPLDLAGTTMETMRIMCEMFGCTILLSTATQPDFSTRKDIAAVPTEIIKDIPDLYKKAKRVTVEWRLDSEVGFVVIAGEMAKKHNACCVVNRKDHAFILFGLLKEKIPDGCFYITTDMCKVHRDDTIKSVTERLENKLPCYLVATSCIEAGVDFDFGCMFRALAPLDSIIQCAGRCNRNGKGNGEMTVFVPDEDRLYPNDRYARAAEIIRLITSRHAIDIDNPEHIKEYYSELYSRYSEDKHPLVNAIDKYDFAEAEKQYRFIPSAGANVLVPYEPCRKLYDELLEEAKSKGISKTWIKKAAPLTISSYQTDKLDEFCEKCFIITKHGKEKIEGWYILYDESLYDEKTGLHFTDETSIDFMI